MGCVDLMFMNAEAQSKKESRMTQSARIKPPMGYDNAWWWEKASQGVLAIQRCTGCQSLRHPPRPMCSECRSLEWDCLVLMQLTISLIDDL